MAKANWKPSPKLLERAMKRDDVRQGLQDLADDVKSRAEGLAASDGVGGADFTTSAGERPKGRPYVDVISENPALEWGSRWVERRRILGRTAEEFR